MTTERLFNSAHALGPLSSSTKGRDTDSAAIDPQPSPAGLTVGRGDHAHAASRDRDLGEEADMSNELISGGEYGREGQRSGATRGMDGTISYPPATASHNDSYAPSSTIHRHPNLLPNSLAPTSVWADARPPTFEVVRGNQHDRTATNGSALSNSSLGHYKPQAKVFGTPQVGTIGKHRPREIVRIARDYSAGETCQFWNGYLTELEGRISATQHLNVMNELNDILASAFNPRKSIFDNLLAVLTLYLSTWLLSSHYDREIARFDSALEKANEVVYKPAGLNIINPRRNGYLFLEIEYY